MSRPPGSLNKRTLADRAAEKQRIIDEYKASLTAEKPLEEKPLGSLVVETLEPKPPTGNLETLNLDEPESPVEPIPEIVVESPASPAEDEPLDLEPPPKPIKKSQAPALDISANRKQESLPSGNRPVSKKSKVKPPPPQASPKPNFWRGMRGT